MTAASGYNYRNKKKWGYKFELKWRKVLFKVVKKNKKNELARKSTFLFLTILIGAKLQKSSINNYIAFEISEDFL